MILTCL